MAAGNSYTVNCIKLLFDFASLSFLLNSNLQNFVFNLYRRNVLAATHEFKFEFDDLSIISEMPRGYLPQLSTNP